MTEIAGFIRDMNEIAIIIALATVSVLIECLKISMDASITSLLVFINLVGIYYMLTRVRVSVNITYR
jgi:hypothetical protein